MRLIVIVLISAALAACSSHDDSDTSQPASNSAPDTRKAASQQRAGTEGMPTEQAERDRRSQALEKGPSAQEAGGSDRRRRRQSARWWENDVIARNIGLSEQQRADIGSAHQQVVNTARKSRQELAEVASAMNGALKSADRERLAELADARFEALEARARAEAEWMKRLLDILSDEQMNKLAEERPERVGALLAPLR